MELSLLLALHLTAIIFLFLSEGRRDVKDAFLFVLVTSLAWIFLGVAMFSIDYYIPNGSTSSYTAITKNSIPINVAVGLFYSFFGLAYLINSVLIYRRKGEGIE